MKERTWLGILLSFAAPCRGKMAASVVLAILSVAGGFVPYLGVYQIIRLFLERQANWEGILFWCGVCLAGYAVKVAGYALSTMLAMYPPTPSWRVCASRRRTGLWGRLWERWTPGPSAP